MKILQSGKLEEKKPILSVCLYCNCQFTFTEDEAKYIDYRPEGAWVVKCPECSNERWMNLDEVEGGEKVFANNWLEQRCEATWNDKDLARRALDSE